MTIQEYDAWDPNSPGSPQAIVARLVGKEYSDVRVNLIAGPFDGLDFQLQARSGDMLCCVQFRYGMDGNMLGPCAIGFSPLHAVADFIRRDFAEGGKSTSMFKPKEAKELWPDPARRQLATFKRCG